jgi:hypothetical protein
MKHLVALFSLFAPVVVYAVLNVPNLPDEGVLQPDNNAFIDPNVDYEIFMGRVSDKDKTGRILKVQVENNNTKFFRAGDEVFFRVNTMDTDYPCRANIRNVEDFYFVIYVSDFSPCWKKGRYFPRGLQLNFNSPTLSQRVLEASKYREMLILRKEGYLKQLNKINHFLWTYDQQKMKVAAEYDEQINELKRKKQLAVDNLLQTKQENLLLQVELVKKLDAMDESLKHYKVERKEQLTDRWNSDHDMALPVGQRPQAMKKP